MISIPEETSLKPNSLGLVATRGDVGSAVFLMHHAFSAIASMMEKLSAESCVDVQDDLIVLRWTVDQLEGEFGKLTGWTSDGR